MTDHKILPECEMAFKEHEKDINSIKKTVVGDDGLGGINKALKRKVSRSTLITIAIVFCGFIVAGLTAWGGAKDERKENKQSIAVVQKEISYIKETTGRIEKNQMKPEDLLREIRKIIRGNESVSGGGD